MDFRSFFPHTRKHTLLVLFASFSVTPLREAYADGAASLGFSTEHLGGKSSHHQLLFNSVGDCWRVGWWSGVLVPTKPRNMNPVVLSLFAALFTNDLLDLKARQEQHWNLAYAYAALDTLREPP